MTTSDDSRCGTRYSITCEYCGAKTETLPHWRQKQRRFCSSTCGSRWSAENSYNNRKQPERHTMRNCDWCKWPYEIPKPQLKRDGCGRHCSKSCATRATLSSRWQHNRPSTLQCDWCGASFEVNHARKNKARFCSQACSAEWIVRNRERPNNRISKVETQFLDQLAQRGYEFQRQVRVGRFWADALFAREMVVAEMDGAYWHSLPKAIERDKRKDKELASLGYEIVHVPEMLFYEDPEKAILLVAEVVDKHAGQDVSSPIQGRLF